MRVPPSLAGAAGTSGTTDATPTAAVAGTPAANHARTAGNVARAAILPCIRTQTAAQATNSIRRASAGMTAAVVGTPAANHARTPVSVAMAAILPGIHTRAAAQATSSVRHASAGMMVAGSGLAAVAMSGRPQLPLAHAVPVLPLAHAVPVLPMAHLVAVLPAAGEMHALPVAQQAQDDLPTAHAVLPHQYAQPVLERQVGSIYPLSPAELSDGGPNLVERPLLHRDTGVVRPSDLDELRRSDTDSREPTR